MMKPHDNAASRKPPPLRVLPAGKPAAEEQPKAATLIGERLCFTSLDTTLLAIDSVAEAFRTRLIDHKDVDTFMSIAKTAAAVHAARVKVMPVTPPGTQVDPDATGDKPAAGPFEVFGRQG